MIKHYLDYNATAPQRPQVLEVMRELQALPLNPSSAHAWGRQAKTVIENSRRTLAEALGVFPTEIIFTASGTEANNWALRTFSDKKIIVSAVEHPSVLKTANALNPVITPVTQDGIVDLDALSTLIKDAQNFIVSVMLANNETGVIQPVREIADLVHEKGGMLHCDAVQAFGKISVNFTDIGCDLMTLSAHKMGGPVGVAALVVKNNLALPPLLTGGGQELSRRAGTENVAAIAGFAKAAELIDLEHIKSIRMWLDALSADTTKFSAREIGKNASRIPNTLCITMPGVSAETQIISFDLEGIATSAGAACSSGRIEPSHVLKAMGINKEEAATAIRISGGWATRQEDINATAKAWNRLAERKTGRAA